MAHIEDVVIVGSGPSGYTAAIYAARAGLRPRVFEGSVTAGGALMQTTEVENYPGFPDGVQGPDLMEMLRNQAERFGAVLVPDDVTSMELSGEIKTVVVSGEEFQARSVILAMGSSYRRLDVPGEDRLSGRGVSWCATCDGFFFRDKEVVVIGGGDSALEEATFLTRFATRVRVIHRRSTLRASRIMQERAEANPKIEFLYDTSIVSFEGDKTLEGVVVRDKDGNISTLEASGAFVAIGHDPRSELVRDQVHVDAGGYVQVSSPSSATNLPGVFACGDLVDHTYRQAITSAGTGCVAALDAEHFLAARAAARQTGDVLQMMTT